MNSNFYTRCLNMLKYCNVENWDGYDAQAITNETLANVFAFYKLIPANIPDPHPVPGNSNDIQLEWHTIDFDLEIDICGNSNIIHCYFKDRADDEDVEKDFAIEDLLPEDLLVCLNSIK